MIRTRLVLSLAAISALLSIPLVLSVVSLVRVRDEVRTLRDREFGASLVLGRLRAAAEEVRAAEAHLASSPDTAAWSSIAEDGRRLSAMGELLAPFELGSASQQFAAAVSELSARADSGYQAARARDAAALDRARAPLGAAVARAVWSLNAVERILHARTGDRVGRASALTAQALQLSALSFLIALALAAAVAVALTRTVSQPVEDLRRGMEAVSEGKLDHRLSTDPARHDEFGYLASGFTGMSSRLRELEKLRASWLSQLTHELKTPLVVMQGTLEMFGEGVHAQLTTTGKDFCGRALRASKTLQRRIMNMIDVGKFLAGHGKIELRPVRFGVFLSDLDVSFHVIGAREGIGFRLTREGALPDEVEWDEDRVREVFENLVSNAFKFTPKSGEVELRVRSDDALVVFEVRDSGAGIPEAALPHLFEPYYQADNQRQANKKGTGLGLAIVKQIVEMHGGTVSVRSTVGQGTTFTVAFPLRAGHVAPAVVQPRSIAVVATERPRESAVSAP